MTRATQFELDRSGGVPVGLQLAEKLERLVADGSLKPGEQLPSVRRMATLAAVNVNTVRSVYARLEQSGLVSSEHGRGTFVRGEHHGPSEGAGGETRARGEADPPDESDERGYRRELMRQIAELERQAAYYTRHRLVGAPEPPRRRPASQLLPAADLIAIRDDLDARVEQLRRDEEERLRLIAADRAATEAERAQEIHAPAAHRRGTASNPPRIVAGPAGWVLKWRT